MTDFHANGSYEAISEVFELLDEPNFAYMVRTTDLEINNFSDNVKYITKKAYNFLSKSQVFGGELLINKIGTPGKSYLMPYLNRPTSLGMNLFLIRINENSCINEKFLYIYFNTNFGLKIINRKINGTVPLTIDKAAIRSLYVPKFESDFIYEISSLVDKVFDLELEAKSMYRQAELLLLDTLKLKDFNPPSQTINIKSFADSFGTSGRLDAEFYQEKYESYLEKIQAFNNGFIQIQQEYSQVKSKSKFDLPAYQYIEIGDINVSDGSYSFNEVAIEDLPANAKIMVKKGDILISTVRPNRGAVAIVEHDRDDLIVSGAFTVLRKKAKSHFNNEFLKVLLRIAIYKDWLLQFNVGTSYPVIKDEDILNLVIPNVEETIQTQIADLILQSNYLRIKSKGLLEKAKKAVELAIEKDQESALDFIKGKQTNDCNVH